MTNTQIFNYNNNPITFQMGDNDVMINATEMAKQFGKRPNDYLSLPSTKELLNAATRKSGRSEDQLVKVINGVGTWLHEDIALDFAQWLSVDFRLWCNDRVKELLRNGVATITNDDEVIVRAMNVLQNRLDARNRELDESRTQLKEQEPRVLFARAVETSTRSCLVAELAKIITQNGYEIGQNRMFDWLRANGYLCSSGAYYNQPTQRAMDLGLFEIKQTTINKPDGSVLVSVTSKVTGKGQVYFVNKFLGSERIGA